MPAALIIAMIGYVLGSLNQSFLKVLVWAALADVLCERAAKLYVPRKKDANQQVREWVNC